MRHIVAVADPPADLAVFYRPHSHTPCHAMQYNLGFTPNKMLASLFQLRFIAILAQLAVLGYVVQILHMPLPLKPLLGLVTVLSLWNALTWIRLRHTSLERWPATSPEASLHLTVDILVLTGLLYFSGGPANPFVSAYLVPIAIAATALPAMHAWGIAALCVSAYSLLLWKHIPLPHAHGEAGMDFNLHVTGMWANFILSALLIAAFVSLLATAVRRRDQALARQREEALRNEQILALGTQAAGTAHELNTPLSTMAILVEELRQNETQDSPLGADLKILAEQLQHCRERISELVDQAQDHRKGQVVSAQTIIEDILERWSLLRPETTVIQTLDKTLSEAFVLADPTLMQALINLLSNAADASAEQGHSNIHLHARVEAPYLRLDIDDAGPGLNEQQQKQAGEAFFTTKTGGLGMGLVLSNATLERLGGQVTLQNRSEGGTRATVLLPLQGRNT